MFRELEPLWVMSKEKFSIGVWWNVMWTLVKRSVLLLVRCWAWGLQVKGQERKWTWVGRARVNRNSWGQTRNLEDKPEPVSLSQCLQALTFDHAGNLQGKRVPFAQNYVHWDRYLRSYWRLLRRNQRSSGPRAASGNATAKLKSTKVTIA